MTITPSTTFVTERAVAKAYSYLDSRHQKWNNPTAIRPRLNPSARLTEQGMIPHRMETRNLKRGAVTVEIHRCNIGGASSRVRPIKKRRHQRSYTYLEE